MKTILRINAIAVFAVLWFLLQCRLVRRLVSERGPNGEIPPAPRWHSSHDEKDEIIAIAVTFLFLVFLAYSVNDVWHRNLQEPESQGVSIIHDGQ